MVKNDHFRQNRVDHISTIVETMVDILPKLNFGKILLQSPYSLDQAIETVY